MSLPDSESVAAEERLPVLLITGLPGAAKKALAAHLRRHREGQGARIEVTEDAEARASSGPCTVVAVVDTSALLADFCSQQSMPHGDRPVPDVLTEQIELAHVIVLERLDRVSDEHRLGLIALVTALNPAAVLLDSEQGSGMFDAVMEVHREAATRSAHSTGWMLTLADEPFPNANHHGISTLLFRERRPFHPMRLAQLLSAEWPGVVRAKGVFWIATRPDWAAELSQAGAARRYRAVTSWWAATLQGKSFEPQQIETFLGIPWDPAYGDRRQELAFVGVNFDAQALRARLEACLLDDPELARGRETWLRYPDPFPPWGLVATARSAARYN